MFDNPEVVAEELPQADQVAWQPMDPKLLRRKLSGAGLAIAIVTGVAAALQVLFRVALAEQGGASGFGLLWLVPLVAGAALIAWPFFSVPRMAFALRERDILYRGGVFWHTVTAVPFNRIQHVEKSSSPLDRRFRLASLKLYTAGGASGDLTIHGLSARTAEKLRAFILERTGTGVEQR